VKKELWLIFSVVFLGLLGFGVVIPTLPFVAEKFGAGPTQVGLLIASYSLFQFVGSPILGRLSDQFGRKPILSFSLLGSAAGFFLIAFAHSLPLIFVSRIIDGLTGGNISVAQAYIADVTEGRERTKAMGLVGAAFGLGFVFGPLIGAVLSGFGWPVPYLFAGLLALADSILILIILPETESGKAGGGGRSAWHLLDRVVLKEVFTPRSVFYLALIFFAAVFSFSLMQGMFALYSERVFGWGERENGYFFTLIGLVMVLTQGVIIRKLVRYVSDQTMVRFSTPLLALSLIAFVLFSQAAMFYLIAVFMAISFGIFNTAIQAEISKESGRGEQGMVLGTIQGFGALARSLGPVIGGLAFKRVSIGAPFVISGSILLAASGAQILMLRKS
jgi:DHA1 family tetracycline resistance protein-like MFS transporter